jgi:hypothetical protein
MERRVGDDQGEKGNAIDAVEGVAEGQEAEWALHDFRRSGRRNGCRERDSGGM